MTKTNKVSQEIQASQERIKQTQKILELQDRAIQIAKENIELLAQELAKRK